MTKEQSNEVFRAKVKKLLSEVWFERLSEGVSTKQLSDRAGMSVTDFETSMSVPRDMNFSILGALSYALGCELTFDINMSKNNDDEPAWPKGRPDYTPEEMRILRTGFPSEEDKEGWVTIEQTPRKVEIIGPDATNHNLTTVRMEDSRHLNLIISCGDPRDGKLAGGDIWIKRCLDN